MKKIFAAVFLLCVLLAGHAEAQIVGNPIKPVATAVAAASLIAKNSPGFLYGFSASNTATAGYIMVFDAVAVPADGTVTPILCSALPSSSTISAAFGSTPVSFVNGIVFVFSTTGCYSKTASSTAFITAQVR